MKISIFMLAVPRRCRRTSSGTVMKKTLHATRLFLRVLPVRSENVTEHRMHSEHFSISPEAADKINEAQRIVAVGTTVVWTLESARREGEDLLAQEGATDLFIYPPYHF